MIQFANIINKYASLKNSLKNSLSLSVKDALSREEQQSWLVRDSLSNYLLPVAYDEELQCYLMRDNMIAFIFECYPKPLAGEDTVKVLQGLYSLMYLPEGSGVQVTLWGGDYIEPLIKRFNYLRRNNNDESSESWTKEISEYLLKQKRNGPMDELPTPIRDMRLFFSFKLPINLDEYEDKKRDIEVAYRNIKTTLEVAYLFPEPIEPAQYINIAQLFINPNHNREIIAGYDPNAYIYKQIVQADTNTKVGSDCIKYDGVYGKALTIKQYPDEFSIFNTLSFIGDMARNEVQITCPFALTLNIVQAGNSLKTAMESKSEFLYKQKLASSLSVKLQKKQEESQWVITKLVEGNKLLKGFLVWWIYHDSYDVVHRNAQTLKSLLDTHNFKLQEEIWSLNLNLFLYSTIPLNQSVEIQNTLLKRHNTMFDFNAAHLSPVQSDWKGTGTPVVFYRSRRGQLMFFNFFDGSEGFNGIIAAQTGAGKSFVTNHIIYSYYSLPNVSNIWVIDIGESYKPLCELLGGTYIDFNDELDFCLNPFSDCTSLGEDMDLFISLLSKMAKPTENITDTEKSVIEEAIARTFQLHGQQTNIDRIIEMLDHMDREIEGASDMPKKVAITTIATNLFRWGSAGAYGKYFNGVSNINLANKFVVLELRNIGHREDLRNVILMILFYHVSKVIYIDDDKSKKKILIFDEAWQFLSDPKISKFIERAYRTFRKHGSSAVTITQGVSDFYQNDATREIMFQASYWLLLKQKTESINLLKREERLALSDYEFEVMESVRTVKGKYSEIFFVTPHGRGVGRLTVPRFLYWIYTTDSEEVAKRNVLIAQHGFKEGIKQCIEKYG